MRIGLLLFLFACGSTSDRNNLDAAPVDAGSQLDAATARDAGMQIADSGTADAALDAAAQDASTRDSGPLSHEASCEATGGTVGETLCCSKGATAWMNNCFGACGCSPDNSTSVTNCLCRGRTCWDGTACVEPRF